MPRAGANREEFPQVMNLAYATRMVNYIPHKFGVEKREGIKKLFERAGAYPITLLEEFLDNVWIIGYSTKVEAYNTATDTWTTIKSDWDASSVFDGERYGEYFLVCNGVGKVWRIDNTLAIEEITDSPITSGLKVIGARLYTWYGDVLTYSAIDDGTDPPFETWTQTSAADTAGNVKFKRGGTIRAVAQAGPYTVAFSDSGFMAFFINTIDSAGTLKKIEVVQNYTVDYGGARGAIETPDGIYYLNEAGLWLMVAVGQTDTPMSKQQILTSTLLGSEYFKDVTQSSSDIVYDERQKCVFATVAKNSTTNNLVIGYKPELKACFEFKGWNINRFAKKGDTIYGASSVKTTVYELFNGYDDDGLKIGTEIVQEIPLKTLFHAHALTEFYAGGALSSESEIKIGFDIYDKEGVYHSDKVNILWTPQNSLGEATEWTSSIWGEASWGGGLDLAGLVNCFDGGSPRISNFQRLIMRITSGDTLRHILYWAAVKTEQKQPIRRRHITIL